MLIAISQTVMRNSKEKLSEKLSENPRKQRMFGRRFTTMQRRRAIQSALNDNLYLELFVNLKWRG